MKLDTFITLLDQHGTRQERWPQTVRAQMEALLAQSVAARDAFSSMQDLEDQLRQIEHTVTPGLEHRILSLATASRPAEPVAPSLFDHFLDWLTAALWRPALLSLAPLVLGALLGVSIEPLEDESMNMAGLLLDEVYAQHE